VEVLERVVLGPNNAHRNPMLAAVTIMKITSANMMVATMTPMIISPNGKRSRARAASANVGVVGSLKRMGVSVQQRHVAHIQYYYGVVKNHPPKDHDCLIFDVVAPSGTSFQTTPCRVRPNLKIRLW
jgi:hypothetical protein